MARRDPALRTGGAILLTVLIGVSAVGCAPEPDPTAAREAFSEVTESPAGDSDQPAADEFSIELNPDPLVDPVDCTPYLVITARGTSEPSRGQLLSPVAKAIEEARPDQVTTLDIDYPADSEVNTGATRGVRWLLDTIRVQSAECPRQKFVLLGYSQGALVIGDALAAPETRLIGGSTGELTEDQAERIIAVVLYGDPRFRGTEPYDVGSFSPGMNGILPREEGSLATFADRIRDYCEATDFICQATLNIDEGGHVAYYDNGMQQDGAAFVITLLDPLE